MLSKDGVDAGKLDTSCRILLGNTSVVKVGINVSAVEVRDAKAGDVDTSRPRVDVGSMSKTCELESEISATEVVSGTSCGLVVGVSSLKENKDVGEGEKSKVVKSSSVTDVMDMICEVSKAVGEGCSDPSKTWLETGASRLIMLEDPNGSLELASSMLMVGVGKISTTNVLSVSGGPDTGRRPRRSGSFREAARWGAPTPDGPAPPPVRNAASPAPPSPLPAGPAGAQEERPEPGRPAAGAGRPPSPRSSARA